MWIPETARSEIAQDNQAIAQMVMLDEAIQHFTDELRSIDPDLELVKANNGASLPGLTPGYWHVLRKGTPTNILCLEGPNGEFREPGSWVYDWLLEQDMWNDRTMKLNRDRQKKIDLARERQKERERQERVGELNERWKSMSNTSVSMSNLRRPWKHRAEASTP